MHLLGRQTERRLIGELLAEARAGRSGALVLLGEAGIGKTALLDAVEQDAQAEGVAVARLTGHESERQLTFAGLHRLLTPLLGSMGGLPLPQRTAIDVALGRSGGPAPDQFLVGLATLTLLSESAEDQPLICLVDDAQWLDAATSRVLAFVVRRIAAEGLVFVLAMRGAERAPNDPFSDLPAVTMAGLSDSDARTLLASAVQTPVDEGLRERVVVESRGNPLALLELSRATTATQLASALTVPESISPPHRVEALYRQRWESLPSQSRLFTLLASAEPTGDPALLWSAAATLGIDVDAAAAVEAADLLDISASVRFRHPLARSAVYGGATETDRRRAHAALGASIDAEVDQDRRAWHRAKAVEGTDESVAEETVAAAERALARGAMADAAALLERASELTPDRSLRAQRALLAASALHEAGSSAAALRSLSIAESGPLDDDEKARISLYRSMIHFDMTHAGRATAEMVAAAAALAPIHPAMARETYLVALNSAVITGGGDGLSVREVAGAAVNAPAPQGRSAPADLLLDALVAVYTKGFAASGAPVREALAAFRRELDEPDEGDESERTGRWLAYAARTAGAMFDDELSIRLGLRNAERVRESGSLASLPAALVACGSALAIAGDLAGAADFAAQTAAVARATGAPVPPYADLFLAAWRGREADAVRLAEIAAEVGDGDGAGPSLVHYALAVGHNATGRYAEAADEARRASRSAELVTGSLALPELVEGASRAGQREAAIAASEELLSRTSICATPMAQGMAAQARALVTDDESAEGLYEAAIEHLERTRLRGSLARAQLTYGEWLRRAGQRQRAREQLRTAHATFLSIGAEEFAQRAAGELRATGEHPRSRTHGPPTLTDQELHIARLVARGGTSREVAAQLFLSPRTIEAHLRSIFRKLDITSRRQLRELDL